MEYSFKSKQIVLALAMLAPTLIYGQSGTLDPSFGTDGIVTTDFAGAGDGAAAVAVLAGGISFKEASS